MGEGFKFVLLIWIYSQHSCKASPKGNRTTAPLDKGLHEYNLGGSQEKSRGSTVLCISRYFHHVLKRQQNTNNKG